MKRKLKVQRPLPWDMARRGLNEILSRQSPSHIGGQTPSSPVRILLLLFSLPLLILLIGVIRRFFDASMQERISRYLASPEGRTMARVYILLVITAIIVTFPVQLRFTLKKGHLLCVKGVALVKFCLIKLKTKFHQGVTLHTQGRHLLKTQQGRGLFKYIHRKHRRKTV